MIVGSLTKRLLAGLVLLGLFAAGTSFVQAEDKKPVGTIEIDETQVALLISGSFGGGKLHFDGKTHDFTIGGLGIGGIGGAHIKATGEVYDLKKLSDFPGVYGQARAGWVWDDKSEGNLWLQNTNGVVLHLKPESEGVMLDLGADGIVIKMDE